ncbi:phosphotransferase family protein [Dactylosporangium matsuzakiense]|uniref:Aminoglycoside phosphotransferase domain-containing protein n=1 Tax=Dactylosporangium matsuzakiense TaxID=53360 RepID=A0A9W6NLB7_9ACTN|nr:aminoglycoside phosphotransferase family protein [Dactylosporangium matsuzakiense]UWZ41114.1 hypothetical protein Dmats_25715 [Dactylosporangium matsuzakiense]GLL00986.1 hypothetical protein GCM10017581_027270 [Dactylosporangium matsuzakiense]
MGWSARYTQYPRIARRTIGDPARSVIVKTRRPGDTAGRERAALAFLEAIGSDAGPRLLGYGDDFEIIEDLGPGDALEDLLVGDDPQAATAGFVAFAEAVGRMHAATRGRADAFYARLPGVDRRLDRLTLAGATLPQWWSAIEDLSPPAGALDGLVAWMAEPGPPMLVLSSGDVAPQNCRIGAGRVRLLDFESARFQHALLDAAHLRLPFYGPPCWARIPAGVGAAVESAYRRAAGLGDDEAYDTGMAAATAIWAVVRLARLPKLLAADAPQPMGFSRRGQLLDTLQVAVDAAPAQPLGIWLTEVIGALRRAWPHLPPRQAVYPAFR